jgi:DNA replication protein DnaC
VAREGTIDFVKRHEIQVLRRAGHTLAETAALVGVSQSTVQRLSRRAGFPFLEPVDDFDFTYQTTVKLSLLGSAVSPDFVSDERRLVLFGKPERGETHLAVAIAYPRYPERLRRASP